MTNQQQQQQPQQQMPLLLKPKSDTFRAFFAVNIPPEVQQKIMEILHPLQYEAKFHCARWTKPENLHITLRFLGNITQAQYEAMIPKVRVLLESFSNFDVDLASLLYFPSLSKPRVLILQPASIAKLIELMILIDKIVVECGVKPETKPFAPHLTVARLSHVKFLPMQFRTIALSKSLPALPKLLPNMTFTVGEVVLLRSDPSTKGSFYTLLQSIKLQDEV